MTTLPVWWDGPADGPANMAADERLAAVAVAHGGPVVRFYGWHTTTVSLGAFQRIAEARNLPAIAGVPLVRRPSGGGAIVHGSDLTYAVAVPRDHPLGGRPQALYTAFHAAFVDLLADLGVAAGMCPATAPADRGDAEPFLCFDRRAEGDVVVPLADPAGLAAAGSPASAGPRPAKILGSAQRRFAGAVVQHGSLLLAAAAGVGPAARHPGLGDLHPAAVAGGAEDLARRWLVRVARGIGGRVAWQDEPSGRGDEVGGEPAGGVYATARWLERR